MLNGLDPIIIFNLKTLTPRGKEKVNAAFGSALFDAIDLPVIPVYLSRQLTGLIVESEDKNVDIDTNTTGLADGTVPITTQQPLINSVTVHLLAEKGSLGVTLLAALADLIYPKVASKEYSVTYIHGAITIFAGLFHSMAINESSDNDLIKIEIKLIKDAKKPILIPQVSGAAAGTVLGPGAL